MKRSRIPKERSQPKKERSFFVSILIGTVVSLCTGMLLLALSCFPALMMEDPARFAPAFSIVSLFVSTAVGSYLSARTYGKNGLACGAVSALLVIAVLVIGSLILEWKIKTVLFAVCAPALLICAMIAGICGIGTEKTKKPRHKVKF